jgi:hypothetical protein
VDYAERKPVCYCVTTITDHLFGFLVALYTSSSTTQQVTRHWLGRHACSIRFILS